MTPEERAQVLRSLPSIRMDAAWSTLPPPYKRDKFQEFILPAGTLYQLCREVVINGVKRHRVEKRFQALFANTEWELLEPVMAQPTKENLYPLIMLARLRGSELPAPVEYFQPDAPSTLDPRLSTHV